MTASSAETSFRKRRRSLGEDINHETKWYRMLPDDDNVTPVHPHNSSDVPVSCTLAASCLNFSFQTVDAYREHYREAHVLLCFVCGRILPTAYLLDIHLQEMHDSFFQVLAAQQDMYRCLVEGCTTLSSTAQSRNHHFSHSHSLNKEYDVRVVFGEDPHEVRSSEPDSRLLLLSPADAATVASYDTCDLDSI
ncbi:uncharacterized protein SPPG_07837 [Spizellomyces punctatus DAOM BR117]|uniref:C2H2-type domain-containing protein n=1 Tax=Spizellomyces punctatus (strain DAOM BR117) TaxID=645134 RepID=A0A0L0H8M1_SPIPD|nr:uncharacterized protein SPPG_07837 [Spizellomyces punctatus DAOM BR117]KNC97023.1 hypothetical protein SPPG_07837 [Spizellomyces punctatus DAOM BR117]|eukprot:XP_016605063.1 hypothetical protein SPPG_07837 [Spizellomyces punctatus DAOM BR117]